MHANKFPIKIEAGLTKVIINDKTEINAKIDKGCEVGCVYKIDNGKEYYESVFSGDVSEPSWNDLFPISLMTEHEIVFFQLILVDKSTDVMIMIDSFDLRSSEIIHNIDPITKKYTDVITTSSGNQYHILVKKRSDEISKLKNIDAKIEKKTQLHSRLNQIYTMAKEAMENLYHKNGMDLIKEWGFMSKKSKDASKTPLKNVEETKSKPVSATPKAKRESPFMNFGSKGTSTPAKVNSQADNKLSQTLKPSSAKFKEALAKTIPVEESKDDHAVHQFEKGDVQKQIPTRESHFTEQPITSEHLRKESLKRGRAGFGSSLIGFSLNEVSRTAKVKSEYNMSSSNRLSTGQLFSTLDAKLKIGNLINEDMISNDNDNANNSTLSFQTSNFKTALNQSMIGLSFARLNDD